MYVYKLKKFLFLRTILNSKKDAIITFEKLVASEIEY